MIAKLLCLRQARDTSASKTFVDASKQGIWSPKGCTNTGSCTMHVLQYLVETSLCQGLLNVERCIGAVQKWRHWGREGGKISRSRLLLFKNANSIDFSVTVIFEFPLQAGWLGPYEDVTVGEYFQRLIAWNVLRWRAIYWRIKITIGPLVCFSNMIVCFLAGTPPPSTADEHIIWKTPKSVIIPSICPILAWGFIEP